MRSSYFYIFLWLIVAFSCIGPSKNARQPKPSATLFTVGDKKVSNEEFLYVYTKNNFYDDSTTRQESVEEYLDLFINFKLKVLEAENMGLDEQPGFKHELAGYKKQLAQPYLTENKVTEAMVREAYDRLKTEIDASHILITVSPDAQPEDTLKAYRKIQDIRKKIVSGKVSFAEMAVKNSQDPSAKSNEGDLGYFTALQMVYPFEQAAYNTPEGEISQPVRTQFGYHIVKVNDKRPSQGKVRVAHIMVRSTEGMNAEDSVKARRKVFEIYRQLENGTDWDHLAEQFSDDFSTRNKGGVLPWFGTGDMIPEFEQVAFSLKEPGDYSEPVKTVYGWHIIKLIEHKGLEPFEQMKPVLKRSVSKASRAEINKAALLKRLKKENNFEANNKVWEKILAQTDPSLSRGKWRPELDAPVWKKTLFTIQDEKYEAGDFYQYVETHQKRQANVQPAHYLGVLYDDYVEKSIMEYEEAHLEEKYPEYRLLVQEYKEGILLFQLMDQKVWSQATRDSAGLALYYQQHQVNYKRPARAQVYQFSAANDSALQQVKQRLKQETNLPEIQPENFEKLKKALENEFNAKTPLTLQVEKVQYEQENLPSELNWRPGVYEFQKNGRYYLVAISEILAPDFPELSEVKGKVISDYQDYLEQQWIDSLKKKYPVEINQKELTKIKQRFEES